MLNLVQEVLGNDGGKGLEKAGFESLGRLVGDLERGLQEAEREESVRLCGDPESELVVDLVVAWLQDGQ